MSFKFTGKTPLQVAADWNRAKAQLPRVAGTVAVEHFKNSFRLQAWQGDSGLEMWPKRSPHAPRNRNRALMIDTGRLRRGIRIAQATQELVIVANDVPYARAHNEGAATTLKRTPRMRKFFWAMFYKTKDERWKWMALSKKTTLTIKVPKRQFMGNSARLERDILEACKRHLKPVFNT